MVKKAHNDFRVQEEKRRTGETVWRVRSGFNYGHPITTCQTQEKAEEIARQLNIDPWYLDRGNTRADRAARNG